MRDFPAVLRYRLSKGTPFFRSVRIALHVCRNT